MLRTRLFPLVLAAACWLAGGPGGITLKAWAACRHHAATSGAGAHGHHTPAVPPAPGTPCFCDQMTGGGDLLPAAELVAPAAVAPLFLGTESVVPIPHPASRIPDFTPDLPTPPPIALA
jgi:hypothetical protein